jgi:periplasmic protein TonB
MKGLFEFTGFAGLALALHVAAFQGLPEGSQSAGSGGDALVTVVSASASLSDMVAVWDRPPVVDQLVPAALPPVAPPMADAPPMPVPMPVPQMRPAAPLRPALALPPAPDRPLSDISSAQPDQPPVAQDAPVATVRPKARPEPAPREKAKASATAAAPSPQPAQASQPARTAAGSGADSARGTSGPSDTATLTAGARQSLLAEWGGKIRNRIDRARPQGSGRGTVTVLMTVRRDGVIQNVSIAKSSGQPSLDQIALRTVQKAGPVPAAPAALTDPSYSFRLPVRFD